MQWTSLEAYRAIYDDLNRRRQQVLELLLDHWGRHLRAPTAQELETYNKLRGLPTHTGCWKRLPELADMFNAIHRANARTCEMTGQMAMTWALGPVPGTDLGQCQVDYSLQRRLEKLRKYAPEVTFDDARYILGATDTKLQVIWGDPLGFDQLVFDVDSPPPEE